MKPGEGRWPSPTRIASSLSVRFGRAIQVTASSPRQTSMIGTTKSTAFEATAYYQDDDVAVTAGPIAEYAHVADVTPEFFSVFNSQFSVLAFLWLFVNFCFRNNRESFSQKIGIRLRNFRSWLFLFEEAAEAAEGIGGILPLCQCLGGAGG